MIMLFRLFMLFVLQLEMRFQAILIGIGAVEASTTYMRSMTNIAGSVSSERPVAVMTLDRFRDIIDIVFRQKMDDQRLVQCLKMVGDALIAVSENRAIRSNLEACFQGTLDPIISTGEFDSSILSEWSIMSGQLHELMPPTSGAH